MMGAVFRAFQPSERHLPLTADHFSRSQLPLEQVLQCHDSGLQTYELQTVW